MFETQVANGDAPLQQCLQNLVMRAVGTAWNVPAISNSFASSSTRIQGGVFLLFASDPLMVRHCLRLSERARTRESLAAAGRLDGSDSHRARFRVVPSLGELFPVPISRPSHFYIMGDGIHSLSCFVVVRSTAQVRSPPWSPDERKLIKQGVCPQAIRFLN